MKIKGFVFKFLLLVFIFLKSAGLAFSDSGNLPAPFSPLSGEPSISPSLLHERNSYRAQPLEVLLKPVFKEQIALTLDGKKKRKSLHLVPLASTQLTIKPQLLTPLQGHRDIWSISFFKEPQQKGEENGLLMKSTKKNETDTPQNIASKKGQLQFQENNLYFYFSLKRARSVILDIKNKRKDWKIKKIKLLRTHKDLYILSLYKADTSQDVFIEESSDEKLLNPKEKKASKRLRKNSDEDLSLTNKNRNDYPQTPSRRESIGSPFYERCLSSFFNFIEEDLCLRRLFSSPDDEDTLLPPENDADFLSFSPSLSHLSTHKKNKRLRRAFRRTQPVVIQPEEESFLLGAPALRETHDEDDYDQATDHNEGDLETHSVSATDPYFSLYEDDPSSERAEEDSPSTKQKNDEPDLHLVLHTPLLQSPSNENESDARSSLYFLAFGALASLPSETEDFEQTLLKNFEELSDHNPGTVEEEEILPPSSEKQKKSHHQRTKRHHRLSLPPFLGALEQEHSHNNNPRRWSMIVTAKERRRFERREYNLRDRSLLRKPNMGCPACGTMVCIGDQ